MSVLFSKSGAPAKKVLNTYFHCLQASIESNCHQIQAPNFLLVKLVSVLWVFKKKKNLFASQMYPEDTWKYLFHKEPSERRVL